MAFEYKVVPAPTKGLKAKGLRSSDDRFANALESQMNALAAEGWEYQRTDTLPAEEREGLMGKTTVFRNMLVFRRPASTDTEDAAPDPEIIDPEMQNRQFPPPLAVPIAANELADETTASSDLAEADNDEDESESDNKDDRLAAE